MDFSIPRTHSRIVAGMTVAWRLLRSGAPAAEFTAALDTAARAWGDYNNDGWSEMFGGQSVWTNNGDGTFTHATPLSNMVVTSHVSLANDNNDGDISMFTGIGPGSWAPVDPDSRRITPARDGPTTAPNSRLPTLPRRGSTEARRGRISTATGDEAVTGETPYGSVIPNRGSTGCHRRSGAATRRPGMRSFKLLLFFSCVLLAQAALASAQDAIDLDDDALLKRVKTEIDALVLADEKAGLEKKALEENGASLKKAREAANAPLPADPGEVTGLGGLDEPSLLNQVELRKEYLRAYRKRKEQLDGIPSLTDARRKIIHQAMEALRITEQRAGDLRPLLTELARRIKLGRISQDKAVLGDKGVDFWREAVVRQQVESVAWLETYSAEKQLPESQPAPEAAETVWNLETDRRLQHSLDVASVLLQAATHEAAEREDLEKTDHAALPTVIVRVHDDWRRALAEYERALDRAEIKRAALAELEADRRDLTPPSKESIPEGEGHSELKTARRDVAFSDQLVGYDTRRLELTRQANDLANELMQELLAIPTAFERARHQMVKLKAALKLAKDWQREGKIATFDFPEGTNVASLAASMRTIAQAEAARRREVDKLKQRINNKTPREAARQELEQEQEKNRQFHNALQEELSYAAILKEMAAKDETTLIPLVEPKGTLDASIEKLAGSVDQAQREFDRAVQALRGVRDALRSVENPYVRMGFRRAPERLAAIKAELESLKDAHLPEDHSSHPLKPTTNGDQPGPVAVGAKQPAQTDQPLVDQVKEMQRELEAQQDFATAQWQYFANLDEKLKLYTGALAALDQAFTSAGQAWSSLINEEKRQYACARELERRLHEGRIERTQIRFGLSETLTRKTIIQAQSDRDEQARGYAKLRKYHQDERDRLQALSAFGIWAKIRADSADERAALIVRPVQRIDAATLPFEDLDEVDRKQLEYDANNRRGEEDVGWESVLAALSRVKKRELFDDSLDTYYEAVTRIDRQMNEYDNGLEAYQELIESCNQESNQISEAPEKLEERLKLRILGYQTARHLAAIAASPSAQLSVEDLFKQTYGLPLPIPEQTHDWDKDYWADRLFAAEARLWGHQAWSKATRKLLSKLGLDAEIARYDEHKASIENKIGALKTRRQDLSSSIATIRADYSTEIYEAAFRTLGYLLLIPLLAWVIVLLVNRFARRIEERVVDGMARDRVSYHERMKTLSSVTRKTVSVVVWIIAGLYLLYEIGTPVSTVLASAGVLGLAIAFGAQSLIRDFFHGFFILLENQYTIGDWIKVGGIEGTVERLTLRVTVLRDTEGTLHFIPNGAVTSVSNMTHGWSQVKMEIGVGYSEDIERVSQVILEAATELCQSPEWKDKVLADPVVPGVQSFGDSALNIRLVVKTQPGVQWGLARALRKGIKERFDKEGIAIPFPQRVIHHVHAADSKTAQEIATQDGG
jgi:small-conductance mechanosensitive channel